MSHHFDTAAAQEDGRLDLCDLYLFAGQEPQTTVLIMTVNPFAGQQSPVTFHPAGIYEFKLDTDGDGWEDVSYRVTFAEADTEGVQPFEVRRAGGAAAQSGRRGDLLAAGQTGAAAPLVGGGRVWIGLAADPFFGNGDGLDRFNQALALEDRFDLHAFDNAENSFHRQNVTGIVLELPNAHLRSEVIRVWATTSLWHPEEQVQINRAANPLMLHLFHQDESIKTAFNQGHPSEDQRRSGAEIAAQVAKVTWLAGTAADPAVYGAQVARNLLPDQLTYRLGSLAHYSHIVRNGRPLADDAMDAVLSLLVNRPFSDGVGSEGCHQSTFPYLAPAQVGQDAILPYRRGRVSEQRRDGTY